MAGANLPAKKYSKKSPTVTRLSFECDGGQTQFIDIGKALSAVNRKFYRQGVYYYVNSVEVYNNETGVVDFHVAPDTWVTKNAWNRGFKLFQKMNSMTDYPLSRIGRPKYHDFKVYLNNLHRTTGSLSPSLHTINGALGLGITSDDWDYSKFVSADSDGDLNTNETALNQEADDFYVHLIGDHNGTSSNWNSVGLIKSYAITRQQPQTSEPSLDFQADADPLLNVFDFSSEEQMNDIIDNLDEFNDQPPYDASFYVGESDSHMNHVARIGTEEGVGRIGRAAGFCAPFGLICVDPHGVDTLFRVVLNLAVGTYHGVYAERA